jgi:hypothetical protein
MTNLEPESKSDLPGPGPISESKTEPQRAPESYLIKMKCGGCKLHFIACSWHHDWLERRLPYCPECGQQRVMLAWVQPSDRQIYEVVPGSASLT